MSDEDEELGGGQAELDDVEYEDPAFNRLGFKPEHFLPPTDLTKTKIFTSTTLPSRPSTTLVHVLL